MMSVSSVHAREPLARVENDVGAGATAPNDVTDLRRRSAVSATSAVPGPCPHSRSQRVTGSNQWMDRSLCLNCGVIFGQDTRWNIERKAARASRIKHPISVASSLENTSAELAAEAVGEDGLARTSSDDFVGIIELEG